MSDSANTGSAAPAAAWFADPSNAAQWRWWDGVAWTDHVAPMEQAVVATEQVATPALHVVPSHLEPVPAADTPVFPRTPVAGVHPSVTGTFLQLARPAWLGIVAGFVVGAFILKFGFVHANDLLITLGFLAMFGYPLYLGKVAVERVWTELFRTRGLVMREDDPAEWNLLTATMPILQTGDERDVVHCATGQLRGFEASCGEFTITTGSGKRTSTRNFLFAAFRIPEGAAARHPGVSVRERALRRRTKEAKIGDTVEFESIEMDKRLKVRVSGHADPVATRELFGPQLVAALAEQPVSWDQRGAWLFVYQDVPRERARTFDPFCSAASMVARAYWTDQQ